MSRNTLYSLLKIFTPAEIKELKERFRTKNTEHRTCFNVLCKNLAAVKKNKLSKEALFASVYQGEPFNDSKIRHLRSEMCRLLEEYLVEKELKTDEKTHQELLTRALFKRPDYDLFASTVKKRLDKLEELPARGKAYFQEKAHHYIWLLLHPETEKFDKDNTWLTDYIEHLQHAFAITNLEIESERHIAKRFLKMEEAADFTEVCTAFSARNPDCQTLHLFSRLFQLYQRNEATPDELNELKNCLFENLHKLDNIEKRMALKLLSYFPVRMLNHGTYDYAPFIFELFKKAADEGFMINMNGQLDAGHFINVFVTACRNHEFEWAKSLLRKYENQVPAKDRKIVAEVCQATFLFQKALDSQRVEDYREVLKYTVTSLNRNHWRYNVRQRDLSVRSCYELFLLTREYGDELEKQLKNFDSYLHKNTILVPELTHSYLKFNQHLRSLYRMTTDPASTKSQVDKFIQKVTSDENVWSAHWLKDAAKRLQQSLRR